MFSVVKTKKIWFSLSAAMFALSFLAMWQYGFKLGIDFTNGSLMEVSFAGTRPESAVMQEKISAVIADEPHIQSTGDTGYIIRMPVVDEPTHQKILGELKKIPQGGEVKEARFETVGPTVSAELRDRAIRSLIVVLIAIVLYVAWAFRGVSFPLPSWKYGVVAVVALLHDVFIPAGIFSVLGHFLGYEIDMLFVTAILTILGFSVHDTIVTFDRVREHLRATPKADFADLIDRSVRETFRRSIFTSMTVLLVLLPVYFWGGSSIEQFVLTLIIGVIFGTYSSIFIACPLLVEWNRLAKK